jgi:endonuclease YncB( thermonuclease family)
VLAAALLCSLCVAGSGSAVRAAGAAGQTAVVLAGKVTRVVDGDTIDVLLASGFIRVRFHGIDAPESNQPGGSAASSWLRQQLRDQQVLLEPVSQDQYDRVVAVVFLQDRNINRELVRQGHAWAYRRYMRRSDRELCQLEDRARRERTGLWATAAAHAPWEHRSTKGKGPYSSYGKSTAEECRKAIGRR